MWLDDVRAWTCLSFEEALRATEDSTVWWKTVHDAGNSQTLKEG